MRTDPTRRRMGPARRAPRLALRLAPRLALRRALRHNVRETRRRRCSPHGSPIRAGPSSVVTSTSAAMRSTWWPWILGRPRRSWSSRCAGDAVVISAWPRRPSITASGSAFERPRTDCSIVESFRMARRSRISHSGSTSWWSNRPRAAGHCAFDTTVPPGDARGRLAVRALTAGTSASPARIRLTGPRPPDRPEPDLMLQSAPVRDRRANPPTLPARKDRSGAHTRIVPAGAVPAASMRPRSPTTTRHPRRNKPGGC